MNIASIFNSYAGMYSAQSVCHSVIAVFLVNRALRAWKIHDPLIRQRFRIIGIMVPVFSFPVYQIINPGRSSLLFRLDALFDVNRWLGLDLWGTVSVGSLFLLILALTAVVFLVQEMVPVFLHTLESRTAPGEESRPGPDSAVARALASLSEEKAAVLLIEDDEPVLFSTTGKNPAIYLSSGLANSLTFEQLRAALAHELAHIRRNKRPLLVLVFLFRIVLFFNPVVLVTFRRAVRDEEKICDDIAVSMTHNPAALAEALGHFYHKSEQQDEAAGGKRTVMAVPLEEYGHNLHLESRIRRLEEGPMRAAGGHWPAFGVTVLTILALNYFIV